MWSKLSCVCSWLLLLFTWWTNFMRCRSEYAHCLFNSTSPPNSFSLDLLAYCKRPFAKTIAFLAETTPPFLHKVLAFHTSLKGAVEHSHYHPSPSHSPSKVSWVNMQCSYVVANFLCVHSQWLQFCLPISWVIPAYLHWYSWFSALL